MARSPVVRIAQLSEKSGLLDRIKPGDFIDCYAVSSSTSPRQAAEIVAQVPTWVRFLVCMRNVITAPFGLAKDGPDVPNKIGFFPVESETKTEIIAGFDDKHLDFRVSVFSEAGEVAIATWVHPHNFGGRIYLRLIMPFHILVTYNSMKRLAAAVERGSPPLENR